MESIHRELPVYFYYLRKGGICVQASLQVGEMAPDFSLPATTIEKISLSDYRGQKNIVVAFYGMDFTPG